MKISDLENIIKELDAACPKDPTSKGAILHLPTDLFREIYDKAALETKKLGPFNPYRISITCNPYLIDPIWVYPDGTIEDL